VEREPVVYVVDDDEAVRDSLKILLESYGLTVEDYASTAEFSRRHEPGRRACMVLDLHLPGTNGLDFLNSPQAPAELPVIMISGRAGPADRARAAKAGVVAFFDKPVANDQLVENIRRVLS
jgi:two-component system response regulator FixJ